MLLDFYQPDLSPFALVLVTFHELDGCFIQCEPIAKQQGKLL